MGLRAVEPRLIVGYPEYQFIKWGYRPAMLFKSLKAHASRHALLTLAVCTLIPAAAMAEAPVFTPAAGWEVGAAQLSNVRGLKSMKLPCVISTEYDNGYVVRFSGGGGRLLALAVDFRQNVFKQGRQYDAMLSIGDGYAKQVKATAFTTSTLIFNLRPLGDIYNVVQNGSEMELAIEENDLKFSLGRIGAAYNQLESCYAGGDTPPIKPATDVAANGAAPVAKVDSEKVDVASNAAAKPTGMDGVALRPLPRSFNDIVQNSDAQNTPPSNQKIKVAQVTPKPAAPAAASSVHPTPNVPITPLSIVPNSVSHAPDDDGMATTPPSTIAVVSTPPAAPVAAATRSVPAPIVWEAKAGEDMKIVLSRWAERAGYDLQWQADQDGKVAQDIKLTGSFEDAVGQLMAENSAATGFGAHVQTAQGSTKDLGPKASAEPAPKAPATKAMIPAMHDDWTAARGANIQSVLNQWGSEAGVTIVWQSYMSVPVKQPVQVSGTFEEAVQTLLDQYMNDPRRPVGQLNIDPESGERTLLMDTAG